MTTEKRPPRVAYHVAIQLILAYGGFVRHSFQRPELITHLFKVIRMRPYFPDMPIDPKLRRDVRELSTMLGAALTNQEGEGLFQTVEKIRLMTKSFRRKPTKRGLAQLESFAHSLSPQMAHRVVRAFHVYFLLANAADEAHRIRARSVVTDRPEVGLATPMKMSLASLKGRKSVRRAAKTFVQEASICPVFTAHPTEATRQTILQKLSRITQLILDKDRVEHNPLEREKVGDELAAQIALLWQTSELRSNKVTVRDEVLRGQYFFSEVLFDAVPRLSETIEKAFAREGVRIRFHAPPVRIGSWIGGDRDGHPFVTSEITRLVFEQHRDAVIGRYTKEVERLYSALSSSERIAEIPPAFRRWVRRELESTKLPHLAARTEPSEIYRWALRVVHSKLRRAVDRSPGGYRVSTEFEKDVVRIDSALRKSGAESVADYFVRPLLQAIRAFGFFLVRLDMRENARLLRASVGRMIARYNPDLKYGTLSEREKQQVLVRLIRGNQSILDRVRRKDTDMRRLIEEFRTIAMVQGRHGSSAIGTFILSNTERVSDLLAALLLAKERGLVKVHRKSIVTSRVDIVPLFETIADLRRSPETLHALLSNSLYRSHLRKRNNRQEIMIGYSDSAKDGGIVSAAYELYSAQIRLNEVATKFGIRPIFFHGRGGSISRGGGPVYESILAQPRETMNGELKITEQGEMISAKYLIPEMALYSMELMVAAVFYGLNASLRKKDFATRDDFMHAFAPVAEAAREAYTSLTRHPDFWEFFSAVTPLDIIKRIEIGSRPASRARPSGLASLRAIPWVFSWTQCRLAITGWFGFGSAVEWATSHRQVTWAQLRRMYLDWPFFRALVNNIEMVLAKTDLIIADRYLALGEKVHSSQVLRSRIREEYDKSRRAVLRIKHQTHLLERDVFLRQSLQLRNPYLDPIHFIQVRFLRELRENRSNSRRTSDVLDLLRSSVNGIAAGMKNTG